MNFGDFSLICDRVPLSICPALGLNDPKCFARNVNMGSWLVFQPATVFVDLAAILMTLIMIFHIKSKYTAVGRKEMVLFFYFYLLDVVLELLLVSNIIPFSSGIYKYAAALHVASITTTCLLLMLNGFVGFQWAEDGTKLSVWSFRLAALVCFAATYVIAIATFLGIAGMSSKNSLILFIVFWIFNAAAIFIYLTLQVILVLIALDDLWSLGDLFFGIFFLSCGLVFYAFSTEFCRFADHYVDGLFLGTSLILLSVMMTYKYWDSITHEDLEFSVGGVTHIWNLPKAMSSH